MSTRKDFFFSTIAFARIVKETEKNFRFRHDALFALQEAAEQYLVNLFAFAQECAQHARRSTIHVRDIHLIRSIQYKHEIPTPQKKKTSKKIVHVEEKKETNVRNVTNIEKYNIRLTKTDFDLLRPGKWLNDNIIDFYMHMLREKFQSRICAFSSFFSRKFDSGYNYSSVKQWFTKLKCRVKFQDLEKIFLPCNIHGKHWILIVLNPPEKKIQIYDSLYPHDVKNLGKMMQNYVADEVQMHFDIEEIKSPQQLNGDDCGVFVCMFAKMLIMGIPLAKKFQQHEINSFRAEMLYDIQRGELS